MNSIRGRLALISALVIAASLTIAGFGLRVIFDSYIERRVTQEMQGLLLDLAGAFSINELGEPVITRTPAEPRYRNPYSGAYWYVTEDSTVVLRSRSLWDAEISKTSKPTAPDTMITGIGPADTSVFVLERPLTLGEGNNQRGFTLGVAIDKSEVDALSSGLGNETAVALGLIGLILFLGAWLQSSYGLRPLASIRQQLSLLHMGQQDRLNGPFPSEIEPLANDLNTLFSHQKDMITKARERAGTLAHGLKTPMTILMGEARRLELSGQPDSSRLIREQLDAVNQQIDRELSRARAHGSSAGIGLHADFSATAGRIVGLMQRMPRGAEIEWHLPEAGIHLAMDADDCGEVLGNLLDNARKWARTKITISTERKADGKVLVSVADDGPGIPAQLRTQMVERGTAGTERRDSSGLGLSIVADLIKPYGGVLTIERSKWGGAHVSFEVSGSAGLP
jgi:signal transduction histidine kinase